MVVGMISGVMASICEQPDANVNWRNEADGLVTHYVDEHGSFKMKLPGGPDDEDGISLVEMLDWWQHQRIAKDSNFPLRGTN